MNTTRHTRFSFLAVASLMLLASLLLLNCGGGGGGGTAANPTYTVTYDGNGGDSGTAPVDSAVYEAGQTVTVPGNTGALIKAGYSFIGWNSAADGTGTTYAQAQTFTMGSANVTLYAAWTTNPAYTVTYDGNGNTGGSVPVDSTNYEQGQTVTVLGNTGNLVKTGYAFAGWNTQADGNGTAYGATFAMGSANVTLYAKWTAKWTGTKQLGTAVKKTAATGIVTDVNGNVYVAGYTTGGLDGNTLTGSWDLFVTKYDSLGNRVRTKQTGTTGAQTVANGVAVDGGGNVYVTGYTNGGLDGNTLSGTYDFFLVKYDSTGNKLYTKQTGTTGANTGGRGVAVDVNGNVYVAGYTYGGLDGNTLTGTNDYFISKFNSSGNKVYTQQTGTAGNSAEANSVTVDGNGNVYVAGYTTGGLEGNALNGTKDFFLAKYDPIGNKVLTKQTGTAGAETVAKSVAVDGSGNVYVTGYTSGGLDGNTLSGTYDFFLTKYDSAGNKLYTKQTGTTGANTGGRGVVVDGNGNVYVAGYTYGGLDGNALTGGIDYFLTMYDSSGNKLFTKQLGVAGNNTEANSVAVDAGGNVFVAGFTTGGLDGNTLTGTEDFFVTKYDPAGNKQ